MRLALLLIALPLLASDPPEVSKDLQIERLELLGQQIAAERDHARGEVQQLRAILSIQQLEARRKEVEARMCPATHDMRVDEKGKPGCVEKPKPAEKTAEAAKPKAP